METDIPETPSTSYVINMNRVTQGIILPVTYANNQQPSSYVVIPPSMVYSKKRKLEQEAYPISEYESSQSGINRSSLTFTL